MRNAHSWGTNAPQIALYYARPAPNGQETCRAFSCHDVPFPLMAVHPDPLSGKRLDSWKEIAAFFGRAERTVKRWEIERGLPVHRMPGGGRSAVFAYTAELSEWLKGRAEELENDDAGSGEADVQRDVQAPPATSAPAVTFDRRPLSRLAAWLVPLVLAAGFIIFLWAGHGQSRVKALADRQPASIRSLAVLPLQNLSNDVNQEYFVDGMTDELITDLAQIRELKVVSKTSIMQYKGTRTALPQIGRELGVDAVIEGSVLRSGDRVRITAQLIRTATDRHVWADSYEGDLKDVFSLQARVAEAITTQVKLNVTAEESGRLHRVRAMNRDAFDLYLHGRYAWNQRNYDGFTKAVEYFNRAVEKDPGFALAYSGLADCYTLLALYGSPADSPADAKAAAEKALHLDDTLAEAHTSLAAAKVLHDWDWQGAEQEFQRAIELNPNLAQAHHWYGNLLLGPEGRHDEAIAELQRAQELDPLSLIVNADVGFAYYLAGRYDLAFSAYQKVLAANPDFLPVHYYLWHYYQQTGQYDLWLKESVENYRLLGNPRGARVLEGLAAQGGFRAAMEEMAKPRSDKLVSSGPGCYTSANASVMLGRNATALNALEDCYKHAPIELIYVKVDPAWVSLRREPRFQNLLSRMHLQ